MSRKYGLAPKRSCFLNAKGLSKFNLDLQASGGLYRRSDAKLCQLLKARLQMPLFLARTRRLTAIGYDPFELGLVSKSSLGPSRLPEPSSLATLLLV